MKILIFINFWFCAFFSLSLSAASTTNPASLGYEWVWSKSSDNQVRADLIDPQVGKTEIFFSWNSTGSLTGSHLFDNNQNLLSTFPGRTLWMGHPSQGKSLESLFLELLRDAGFQIERQSLMVETPEGLRPRPFAETLAKLDSIKSTQTLAQHLDKIKSEISQTRQNLVAWFGHVNPQTAAWLEWATQGLDIIQPVRTEGGEEGARFDAFAGLATQAYLKSPREFLLLLARTAQNKVWNPLSWYRTETFANDEQKLAIMSLITHNHVSEFYFVQSVALAEGSRKAWAVHQALNQLYEAEQRFWLLREPSKLRKNSELGKILEKSGVPFYDQNSLLEVQLNGQGWIPLRRTYHAYGGFIAGRKLRAFHVPSSVVQTLVRFLGKQYKKVSAGPDSADFKMIDEIYNLAGQDATAKAAPVVQAPGSNLMIMVSSGGRLPSLVEEITEPALAKLIESNMKGRYQRIFKWTARSGVSPQEFMKNVNAQIPEGESLDVFTVHHGPDHTFVPHVQMAEVEAIFPKGRIRNVLSSGCSMWGGMKFEQGRWTPTWRTAFGLHMKRLGVNSYLIFANTSTDWWRMSRELAPQISPNEAWTLPELNFMDQVEQENLKRTTPKNMLQTLWSPIIEGRPVFGVNTNRAPLRDDRLEILQDLGDGYLEFQLKGP